MFPGFEFRISWTCINVRVTTQILESLPLYSEFKLEAQFLTRLGKSFFSAINTFNLIPVSQMSYYFYAINFALLHTMNMCVEL